MFAKDELEVLGFRADCAWYLDVSVPQRPRLFLNEGIEGLKRGLEAPAVRGRPARVREALAHSMLQPALLSLAGFVRATASTRSFGDIDGWRKFVLETLAKRADGKSLEMTVEEWLAGWEEGEMVGVTRDLLTSVGMAGRNSISVAGGMALVSQRRGRRH